MSFGVPVGAEEHPARPDPAYAPRTSPRRGPGAKRDLAGPATSPPQRDLRARRPAPDHPYPHHPGTGQRRRRAGGHPPGDCKSFGAESGEGGAAAGFPLGRWLSDQRRAMRAGTMLTERARQLEELDIV
ncbi:helicase associated domain-containing protein [Streptomyces sp. NPDC127178]|uniref:helicase associated domain-containing protein n=1 Tax=unclassified Streptomyces TaxID=2593676 RepID=UPI00364533D2